MASLFTQLTTVKRLTADLDLGSSAGALQSVTDLAIPVINGIDCHFTFILRYTAGANIGLRCGINCDGTGTLAIGEVAANATTAANFASITALNTVIFAATAGVTTAEVAIISGVFSPTQNGTLTFQACNEGSGAMVLNSGSAALYSTNFLLSDSVSVSESITIAITPLLPAVNDSILASDTRITESFTHADQANDLTADQAWTTWDGSGVGIVSNQAKASGAVSAACRLEVDVDLSQLVSLEATLVTLTQPGGANYGQVELHLQKDASTTFTCYSFAARKDNGSTGAFFMGRNVAGAFVPLGSTVTQVINANDVMKFTYDQSTHTLTGYVNNISIISQVDATITGNRRVGVRFDTNDAAFVGILDALTLSQVPSVTVSIVAGGLAINTNDAVTVAELATVYFLLAPNVSDATTVSELFPLYLLLQIAVNDLATLAESLPLDLLLQPIINDGVATSELVTPLLPVLLTTVNDLITLAEAIVPDVLVLPVVFDGVSVSDSATVVLIAVLTLFDTVALADSGTVYFLLAIDAADAVSLAESHTINFVETLPASTFDAVALDELTAIDYFSSILNSSVADSILLDDVPTLNLTQPPLELFAFDDLAAVGGGLDGLTTID